MTPYHHYPRVGLNYCRCPQCGNDDWRDRMVWRIIERSGRYKHYKGKPKYQYRRDHPMLRSVKPKRLLCPAPPYKLRRQQVESIRKILSKIQPRKEME